LARRVGGRTRLIHFFFFSDICWVCKNTLVQQFYSKGLMAHSGEMCLDEFDLAHWGLLSAERSERSELIAISFFFPLALGSLNANLLVILLQSCEIFTRLREFSLFHTFANVPMYECSL